MEQEGKLFPQLIYILSHISMMLATKTCRIHTLLAGFRKHSWGCALLWSQACTDLCKTPEFPLQPLVLGCFTSPQPGGAPIVPACSFCPMTYEYPPASPSHNVKNFSKTQDTPIFCFLCRFEHTFLEGKQASIHLCTHLEKAHPPLSTKFCCNPALSLPFHCHILQAFPNGKAHRLPVLFHPLFCFT